MNRQDVYRKVTTIADKYGSRNSQQLKQLEFILRKIDDNELFHGCYPIFCEHHDNFVARQELAGVMLHRIMPKADFELEQVIRSCLPTYELSVEELPWYLSDLFDLAEINAIIDKISVGRLDERENKALETLKYWLRNK